ncbi:hypothetical protein [Arthrobacter psychrolactophilus]|uniref:hypothetical protein n=1 Tax=Arthrobacter psychrolactophilus TaxID=92442 RepID=UPI001FE629D1|nr:hypothetical protein [Arthrobacter psychrolactophilus]
MPTTIAGVTISGLPTSTSRDLTTNPYTAGEQVPYSFTVKNSNAGTVTVTPTAGNFAPFVSPGTGNCRYGTLTAGSSYNCSTPLHTITADELAAGYFVPETTWTVSGAATGSGKVLGRPVPLGSGVQTPGATIAGVTIAGTLTDIRNVTTSPYAVGETVSYKFSVQNTTPGTLTVTPTAGNFSPFIPEGIGNCRYKNLTAGASYVCSTPRHSVTEADVTRGYFVPDTSWSISGTSTTAGRLLGEVVRLK